MIDPVTSSRRAMSDVEWLQASYEDAEPDQRPRQAGLLGLALADLSDLLDDDDPQLPSVVRSGLDRLAEARRDAAVAAALGAHLPLRVGMLLMRSSVPATPDDRGQSVPERAIADLLEALGPAWSTPPDVGPLAGARWCLATALLRRYRQTRGDDDLSLATVQMFEASLAQGSTARRQAGADSPAWAATERWRRLAMHAAQEPPAVKLSLSMSHCSEAAPRARKLLEVVEVGHQGRPLLRVLSVTDLLQQMGRTEQWPKFGDAVLATLHAVPEVWGNGGSAQERRIARSLALPLACFRLYVLSRHAADPADLDLTELDALVNEFDALRDEAKAGETQQGALDDDPVLGTLRRAVEQSGFVLGAFLMVRAAVANARDGGEADPADLNRSRELLGDAPPDLEAGAKALLEGLALVHPDVDQDPQAVSILQGIADIDPDCHDLTGGRIVTVLTQARQAIATRDVQRILDTLPALDECVRILPATHPAHPELLALHANLTGVQAILGAEASDAAGALNVAVRAAEAAPLLRREQSRQVCDAVALNLVAAIGHDLQVGAFERGQKVLQGALAADLAEDDRQRLRWAIGMAAALALRWPGLGPDERQEARQTVADAERALHALPADPVTASTGFMLFMVLANLGLARADAPSRNAVVRVLEHLEELLATPGLADAMMAMIGAGMPGILPAGMVVPPGAAGLRAVLGQLRRSLVSMIGVQAPPMPAPPSDTEVALKVTAALRVAAQSLADPRPAGLVEAAELLARVLALGVADPALREQVHGSLGRCRAAVAGVGNGPLPSPEGPEATVLLAQAIRHLELATVERASPVPASERADLLDVLARCHRARKETGKATSLARAALHEVLGTVLTARTPEQAVVAAEYAHRISMRAAWWCLDDADVEQAIGLAEAGRALVLASVVLAGRVQEHLVGMGRQDLADEWMDGDEARRSAALGELLTTYPGFATLATPKPGQIAGMVIGSAMDAVAYLLPPVDEVGAETAGDGAMLLVGRDLRVFPIRLPGLYVGRGSPVDRYRRAFAAALSADDPAADDPAADDPAADDPAADDPAACQAQAAVRPARAFRETDEGQAWAAALDDLGAWAHRTVIGPLLDHVGTWNLGRPAHIALIPLGDLGQVPFAAAWTPDPAHPSGRRYAVHDLVLSYVPSGRTLADVARRDQLPIHQKVVLATDPRGTLPHARVAAVAVQQTVFPHATVYLPGSASPCGEVTRAKILAALPADGRDGASLLHLATHGRAAESPLESVLEACDGDLELREILRQARSRHPRAPGGLVICDACLTDATRAQPDESLTLATAFLTAGATGVIGTRWPTDDAVAAALVYRIHHELAQGRPPAHALRLAQIAMIDDQPPVPGTPVPLRRARRGASWADWAAFVHHGT